MLKPLRATALAILVGSAPPWVLGADFDGSKPRLCDIAVKPGSRWLVRGPSGSGKSTLLRALAGLWPFGNGSIDAPVDARMMFIPQQSYLPVGTLKAALT